MSWEDVAKILVPTVVPVAIVVIGWFLNEHSKRRWQRYDRMEERYIALLKNLKGFYRGTNPDEARKMKEEFLTQLNLCWLYCPDITISRAYYFLDHIHTGVLKSDEEKEEALRGFAFQLRKDLFKEKPWPWQDTKLVSRDFRFLSST